DFKPAGALAGDDLLVVIGWNHHIAVLAYELFGFCEPLAGGRTNVDDLRAESKRGSALDGGGIGGHDDDGSTPRRRRPVTGDPVLRPDLSCRIGHTLRVIAARIGDDAARDLLRRQLKNFVGCTANLEGADGLKTF